MKKIMKEKTSVAYVFFFFFFCLQKSQGGGDDDFSTWLVGELSLA